MRLQVSHADRISGAIRPPSDKSLTHRAAMLAAIANGPSVIRRPLESEDCQATLRCLQAMGLTVSARTNEEWRLSPADDWHSPAEALDCGNSGTTLRLLSGLIASRPIEATLIGDASLSRRPMARIAEPLRAMGAVVEGDHAPLRIVGSSALMGIRWMSPVASAQIKSCLLLAGLRAQGETEVMEPHQSRDHTERMLGALGVPVRVSSPGGLHRVSVTGGSSFGGFAFEAPGDISGAAFFMVAAAMLPRSKVEFRDVGLNPTRCGVLDVLRRVGTVVRTENARTELGEPFASVSVESGSLTPFEVEKEEVPKLIDELPVLAVLATQLQGVSVVRGAEELRVKESDRIERMAEGLRKMGAKIQTAPDGFEIEGPTRLRGSYIQADGDHRIAMAFAIAALCAEGTTVIEGAEAIATSYPGFERDLASLVQGGTTSARP